MSFQYTIKTSNKRCQFLLRLFFEVLLLSIKKILTHFCVLLYPNIILNI